MSERFKRKIQSACEIGKFQDVLHVHFLKFYFNYLDRENSEVERRCQLDFERFCIAFVHMRFRHSCLLCDLKQPGKV